MATYLADRVIVFEGQPAIAATATPYAVIFFFERSLFTRSFLDHNPFYLE